MEKCTSWCQLDALFAAVRLTDLCSCLSQVVLVATSMVMTATEEITATLVVWIGGATSHHRSRLPCQPNGNHMLT